MHWKKVIRITLLPLVIVTAGIAVIAQVNNSKGFFKVDAIADQTLVSKEEAILTDEDPWIELSKLQQVFIAGNNVYCSGTIGLHEDEHERLLEQTPFSFEWNDGNFVYTIDSVDLIQNEGLSLSVYHRERMLIAGKGKNSSNPLLSLANLDTLKKYSEQEGAEVKVWKDASGKFIKVENTGNPEVYGYEIHYYPQDYRLKKIVLQLATLEDLENGEAEGKSDVAEGTQDTGEEVQEEDTEAADAPSITFSTYQMEINYNKFLVGAWKKEFRPEEQYVTIQKKKLSLKEAYKDYRIIVAR